MNEGNLTNTSSHMVQEVKNIIDGYKMGSLRALAQEPVQNALDAMREGEGKVEVEYRLLSRQTSANKPCYLLAVTDSGTTGLRGPIVSDEELAARQFKLMPEENWAAFEAQGYTKENEDALGSRGQGKAAYLYHSHVPGETRRMLMLYDTLLADGEYRLGMRFARPVDQRLSRPLYHKEALAVIQGETFQIGQDLAVPLRLTPLCDIGTRVIIPYLDEELVAAMRPGGELERWLQRCWWRAIQTGKLRIRVVNDEYRTEEEIDVPNWWQDLPRERGKPTANGSWRDLPDGGRACIWGDLPIDGGHIRRLVMLHSDALPEDEITNDHPEFAGIQILRGLQWIETRGAREDFGDYIPPAKRPGFRAYVEFDKQTDSMLRAAENSQHDGFKGQWKIVRAIRSELATQVREFSDEMGWETAPPISTQQVTQREKTTHTRFLETFLNPNGRKPQSLSSKDGTETPQLLWDCRLDLDYPDPKSARVDWGQEVRNLYVEVAFEPGDALIGSTDLLLEWVDANGERHEVLRLQDAISKEWHSNRAQQQFKLGDWKIFRGKTKQEQQQLSCSEPGECKLQAVIVYRGERVKSAARTVYVQTEPPPPPPQNPITLSISAENISDDQKRIDHGQVLQLQINSRNRMTVAAAYYLTATFCDEKFARDTPIELEGTPAGDTPRKQCVLFEKRRLLDPHQSAPMTIDEIQPLVMPDSSGVYPIRVELKDENGEPVLRPVVKSIYFQRDPGKAQNSLPFEIRQETQQKEMWKLNEALTELTYPGDYPLYKEMQVVQRQHRALQWRLAFIAEITANGLLEWAFRPKETGDDSNYDQLRESIVSPEDPVWEPYIRRLEKLGSISKDSPSEFTQIWRETVAIMLEIFAKENN
ncbi:MAG: hypothetical protein OXE52_09390 [Chloroflexi bacterium]|nr:hypothetical protein [Chloroflexota bacterium]